MKKPAHLSVAGFVWTQKTNLRGLNHNVGIVRKRILLPDIFIRGDNLQIPRNVQATNQRMTDWNDVINVVLLPCSPRYLITAFVDVP